ncbi:restriction endonuclease subunit S [Helicobacter typhlonius]|uniref:restriction endonuclease subunit S n=1 Tax=Helicobacter typhlonius TaxID=76936 RepID=UPI002FE24E05
MNKTTWQRVKLGEVAEINPLESIKKNTLAKKVSMDNLEPFNKKIYSFSMESFKGGSKFKNGDTLLARITPCLENGKTAFVDFLENNEIAFGSTEFIILREKENISDKHFLYYLARSENFRETAIKSMTGSSGRERVQIEVIKDYEFSLPPLETQHKIAEILSSLDDKIDLLHRQNKTLESLSLTLFRHTFIDNPNRNEWEEKPLSEIADFLNGLACQKLPPQNEINRLPVLKIKELREGITESSDWATSEVDSKYIVQNGDVIFAWSASLMVKVWAGKKCVLNQHLFKVSSKEYPKWFYYFWCLYHLQEFISIALAQATTMGHIKRTDLDNAICSIPPKDFLDSVDKQISPIFEKIQGNSKQIQNLESLRDIMLPKLLSGEMEV